MILTLTLGDALALAFGGAWLRSLCRSSTNWRLNPKESIAKQRAWAAIEEMHRQHREQQSRWLSQRHRQHTDPKLSKPFKEKHVESNGG
jgi:hypothetical protein